MECRRAGLALLVRFDLHAENLSRRASRALGQVFQRLDYRPW